MYNQYRNIVWFNTNKMLNLNGFVGVKTGVTPSAGPCLSSMFSIGKL
jgi:D-alanyl-D-alanine carboxypeptidase